MRNIFGTSGIRGVLGRTHNIYDIVKIISAVDEYFGKGNVLIGWDCRIHSYPLAKLASSILLIKGKDVSNCGIISTPAFQAYLKRRGEFKYGLMFTASHNPPEYFGIKVFDKDGIEITENEELRISELYYNFGRDYDLQIKWEISKSKEIDITKEVIEEYIHTITNFFPDFSNFIYNLKLAADYANCSSLVTAGEYLSRRFTNVIHINNVIDGRFPGRLPEPKPENIKNIVSELIGRIDLGVAFDGDGDRGMVFDGKGRIYWGDEIGVLISYFLKDSYNIDRIVTPISSSKILLNILEKKDIEIIWTKVGAKNVVEKMVKENIIFGFEENGGLIYLPHIAGRDGLVTFLFTLKLLDKEKKKLDEIANLIPNNYVIKRSVKIDGNKHEVFEQIKTKLIEKFLDKTTELIEIDGVKLTFKNETSILVRPSGTEPLIRIFTEARNREEAIKLNNDIFELIIQIRSSNKAESP